MNKRTEYINIFIYLYIYVLLMHVCIALYGWVGSRGASSGKGRDLYGGFMCACCLRIQLVFLYA